VEKKSRSFIKIRKRSVQGRGGGAGTRSLGGHSNSETILDGLQQEGEGGPLKRKKQCSSVQIAKAGASVTVLGDEPSSSEKKSRG